ncbi:hypothetical protein MAR_029941, partial [Mya arenaria]
NKFTNRQTSIWRYTYFKSSDPKHSASTSKLEVWMILYIKHTQFHCFTLHRPVDNSELTTTPYPVPVVPRLSCTKSPGKNSSSSRPTRQTEPTCHITSQVENVYQISTATLSPGFTSRSTFFFFTFFILFSFLILPCDMFPRRHFVENGVIFFHSVICFVSYLMVTESETIELAQSEIRHTLRSSPRTTLFGASSLSVPAPDWVKPLQIHSTYNKNQAVTEERRSH